MICNINNPFLWYLSLSSAASFSNGAFSSAESAFHRSPRSLVTSVTEISGLSSFIFTLSFEMKWKYEVRLRFGWPSARLVFFFLSFATNRLHKIIQYFCEHLRASPDGFRLRFFSSFFFLGLVSSSSESSYMIIVVNEIMRYL